MIHESLSAISFQSSMDGVSWRAFPRRSSRTMTTVSPAGAHVLLRAGVDDAELCHVDRLGHDAGGHISDERYVAGVRNGTGTFVPSISVVEADMYVVRVGSEMELRRVVFPARKLKFASFEEATAFASPYF